MVTLGWPMEIHNFRINPKIIADCVWKYYEYYEGKFTLNHYSNAQYWNYRTTSLNCIYSLYQNSYINDIYNKKHFTSLSAWSISKQVLDHSHGSVRASQHILQQQLVRENLQQYKTLCCVSVWQNYLSPKQTMPGLDKRKWTHLSDDAEAGLVQRCRTSTMSKTSLQGLLSQLPLSCSLVVGRMNLMSMSLKQ